MKSRSPILILLLIAYSLFVGHSVLPHHHFNSYSDFKASQDAHHETSGKQDSSHGSKGTDDNLFFNTHVANVDFSFSTYALNKKAPEKSQTYDDAWVGNSRLFEACFAEPTFHIPIRPPRLDHPLFSSRLLRAPPVFS